jgi:hypothetical protein
MSTRANEQAFLSAIEHLHAPICLDRVPEWLYDLLLAANWSQLRIIYDGHCGVSGMSWVDDQGNECPLEGTDAPEILRRYLVALAASLLDTYIPSWRFGARSSGTMVLDAEGRTATFHNTTRIQVVLRVE